MSTKQLLSYNDFKTILNLNVESNSKGEDDEQDISDDEVNDMVSKVKDWDDVIDEYDEDEVSVVDDETGEEIKDHPIDEQSLMEVLSRVERMRARVRFAQTKSKRERAVKIALKQHSSTTKINKRARSLAVRLMKKKLLRGRDQSKISVGEKERIDRIIEKRKVVIGRLATKLVSRVREIEQTRLSHDKYTKPAKE